MTKLTRPQESGDVDRLLDNTSSSGAEKVELSLDFGLRLLAAERKTEFAVHYV